MHNWLCISPVLKILPMSFKHFNYSKQKVYMVWTINYCGLICDKTRKRVFSYLFCNRWMKPISAFTEQKRGTYRTSHQPSGYHRVDIYPFSSNWNLVLDWFWSQFQVDATCKSAKNWFAFPRPELVRESITSLYTTVYVFAVLYNNNEGLLEDKFSSMVPSCSNHKIPPFINTDTLWMTAFY